MNVISIDLDYFVKADNDTRLTKFPNAEDLNRRKALEAWKKCYEKYPELRDVGLNKKAMVSFVHTFNSMLTQYKGIFMSFMFYKDSHKHLYHYIKDYNRTQEKINLLHIDHHHDFYTAGGETITCANWLLHLYEEKTLKNSMWVHNKDSDIDSLLGTYPLSHTDQFGIIDCSFSGLLDRDEKTMLFVCLSPEWVPPHLWNQLDAYTEFLSIILKTMLISNNI